MSNDTKPEQVFGKNLRDIREFVGMTQAELAKRASLTAPAICMIEAGEREPSLKTIIKLIHATGATFERLVRK